MAKNATIDKTRKDVEKTLSDPTPLFAVVGVGDLAVAKLREAREGLSTRAVELNARVARLEKTAPEQVKALPAKAQAKAQSVAEATYSTAVATYDDLAGRGKSLVTRIRKQRATEDLIEQTQTTVSHAKGTATTAKKSAARTRTAAKSTRTTASKQAKATKTSAKSTTTSARKTAKAASSATKAAADKVGS